jgi:hypothetical protein
MTETELKLRDAETQLRLALQNTENEEVVRSCINSLISAARSVTFVMQRESSGNGDLNAWYDDQIALMLASPFAPLLKFFNEKRVYSIHRGVVSPQRVTTKVTDFKMNDVAVGREPTMIFYRFENVQEQGLSPGDSGGVFRLCNIYLAELRALLNRWLAKRAELGIK